MCDKRMKDHLGMQRCVVAALFVLLMLLQADVGQARRGRGRGKGGGRKNMHTMIPVKSKQYEASAAYYNNANASKIINWSHFESEYILGRKIVFMCTARGIPRPHITWYKNGIELYGHTFFQVHEWNIGDDTLKSKMEIDPATQMDAGYYECGADNKYAYDFKAFRTDYLLEFE